MLSIIIPVYEVVQTLDHCVESVLKQDIPEMEVILVDDGSTDNSPMLCDEWADKDTRIRVIHKQNGGLSSARNAGLEIAKGDLVTFVDSDDYLAENTYCKVLAEMDSDTDIIEFPVYCHYGSARQKFLTFNPKSFHDMTVYWIQGKAYAHTYAWNKIYRRELFKNVHFPEGRVFEDVATLPLLLQCAHKVQQTDQGLYYYCENKHGITANASGEDLRQLLMAHLDNWDVTQDDEYYLHVLNIQIDVWRLLKNPTSLLLKNKCVWMWHGLSARQRIKVVLLNILGMKGLCKLYR